jgi:uncharacterized protein DUF1876
MSHVLEWGVHLYLYEEDGITNARVVLDTGPTALAARGVARCSPADVDVPVIGAELAAGRALHSLADQLTSSAALKVGHSSSSKSGHAVGMPGCDS